MSNKIGSDRTRWFQDARFGMFIHWGLYSLPGGEWNGRSMDYVGEWIQSRFRIPNREYETLAARFNPRAFDSDAWVRAARDSGMAYIVYTAKHHDGFAMFHSEVDPYNISDMTAFSRDPLAELAESCRKYGLRLGLYYSQDLDWRHPDGGDPGVSFPLNFGMSWGNNWDFPDASSKNFDRYFDSKAIPQVRELLTRYGQIDLMWFDCPVSLSKRHAERLMRMVSELQPDCLVNQRIGHGFGDFGSFGDNEVPSAKVQDIGETPMTLNDTWGFKYSDTNWKSSNEVLSLLASTASHSTNLLLNIGPTPEGTFPIGAMNVLEEVSTWMKSNTSAIRSTTGNPFANGFEWGWITVSRSAAGAPIMNLIFRNPPKSQFLLHGLNVGIRRVYDRRSPDDDIPFTASVGAYDVRNLQLHLPSIDTAMEVVTLELEADVKVDPRNIPQWDETITLAAQSAGLRSRSFEDPVSGHSVPIETVGCPGESLSVQKHPVVSASGIVNGWFNPADVLEWETLILSPGDYAVDIVTSACLHSRSWRGGHTMRFRMDGCSVEGELVDAQISDAPETRCYEQGVCRLGVVSVGSAGPRTADLEALKIVENDGLGVTLVSVVLRRI